MKYDKQIDIHIDEITALTVKTMELIYKHAYNEAIADAHKIASETTEYADEILKLKKE